MPPLWESRATTIASAGSVPGRASTVKFEGHAVIDAWFEPMVMSPLDTPAIAGCPGSMMVPGL